MNLKQLEAFIKVSDSKSFSKAAQELYLTQPTVSAHIQTLEKELKSDDMLNNLNAGGNQYIHDYLGFQNGYPILAWEMTLEDFQAGSISSLNSSVSEADYTAENWKQVQKILADAADQNRYLLWIIHRVSSSKRLNAASINLPHTVAPPYFFMIFRSLPWPLPRSPDQQGGHDTSNKSYRSHTTHLSQALPVLHSLS